MGGVGDSWGCGGIAGAATGRGAHPVGGNHPARATASGRGSRAAEGEIRELTGFLADHDARDPACAQARLLLGLLHWFRYLACCDSREFRE
jgi:hypothetical protein